MAKAFAGLCLAVAGGVFALGLFGAVSLTREYGPAEGYGNLILQSMPFVALATGIAGAFAWAGWRLLRRHR